MHAEEPTDLIHMAGEGNSVILRIWCEYPRAPEVFIQHVGT